MDEKRVIEFLERLSEKLDILIEAQGRTIEKLDESHKNTPSLEQMIEEWGAMYGR